MSSASASVRGAWRAGPGSTSGGARTGLVCVWARRRGRVGGRARGGRREALRLSDTICGVDMYGGCSDQGSWVGKRGLDADASRSMGRKVGWIKHKTDPTALDFLYLHIAAAPARATSVCCDAAQSRSKAGKGTCVTSETGDLTPFQHGSAGVRSSCCSREIQSRCASRLRILKFVLQEWWM